MATQGSALMPPLSFLQRRQKMNKEAAMREDAMTIFNKDGLGSVRAFKENDEAWFSVKDVCQILEIQNTTHATENLDDDEKRVLVRNDVTLNVMSKGKGGAQTMMFVNTSGLYTLILRSRKPQAKAFKRWVTHVVLPSILEGRNSAGANAYVYGQEGSEDGEDDLEADRALQAAAKVPAKPPVMCVIGGMVMTRDEALAWDFD